MKRIENFADFINESVNEAENDEIQKIVDNWLDVVSKGDPQSITDLYAEEGVLLGTVAENIKQGRKEIKTYFDMFTKKNPKGTIDSIIFQDLGDDHGVADGNYTFEIDDEENKGKRIKVPARFTYVVDVKSGLIHTHHSSATPEN